MTPEERPRWGVAHVLARGHVASECPELGCCQMTAVLAAIRLDKLVTAAEKRLAGAKARAEAQWDEAFKLTDEMKRRGE